MRRCTCEHGGADAGDAGALPQRQAGDVGQARPRRRDAAVRQLPLVHELQPLQPPQRAQRLDPPVRQLPACPSPARPLALVCQSRGYCCSDAWRARLINAASSALLAFHNMPPMTASAITDGLRQTDNPFGCHCVQRCPIAALLMWHADVTCWAASPNH